ncbi:MAG TPA: VWA domain-containing protein [Vicinamibacterales bacterium]|nr:VWA domain-containing protein [Vicinamibacterales bacterium]
MSLPRPGFPERLAAFCARLRGEHGFMVGPGELHDAVRAIQLVSLAEPRTVREVLRPVLTGRRDDLAVFDRAFDEFFLQPRAGTRLEHTGPDRGAAASGRPRAAEPGRPRDATEEEGAFSARRRDARLDLVGRDAEEKSPALRAAYSPLAAEGEHQPLVPPDAPWQAAALVFVRRLEISLSRRYRPSPRGPRFDIRRTLRSSLGTGGELLSPRWRSRPRRRLRLVLLLDGSRSMSPHAGASLAMAIAIAGVATGTEVFTFSTSLRRITRDVRRAASGEPRVLDPHEAWGGGTAIGACLTDFLIRFADRLLARDSIVIIVSDGLDVGDPAVLRDAMDGLRRRAAAIVWLNPLLETPGYEPSALGMAAARPFVSTFASVQSPQDLSALSHTVRIRR